MISMFLSIETNEVIPLHLPQKDAMTDNELFEFCQKNLHLRIERDETNQIYIMPPAGGETGRKHIKITSAIDRWNSLHKLGEVFDSSTGFNLPNRSMRSPDAAWVAAEKWATLSTEQREKFLPFAPDFLIEVLSPTDGAEPARGKMNKWIRNGTRLAWLIVPAEQVVFIYRANGTVNKVQWFENTLYGEDVLPGFQMELSILL